MAGNENREAVGAAGLADGAHGLGIFELIGDPLVGAGFTEGDGAEDVPHLALEEGGRLKIELQRLEWAVLAAQIGGEPGL